MEETKRRFTKKRVGIFALVFILLLAAVTYFSIQWVEAKEIREQLDLGHQYYEDGRYEEAIIAFQGVLELDEKNVEARIGLAKSYLALERYQEAEETLLAGIQILPQESSFYIDIVDVYLLQGKVVEAISILDQGMSITNDPRLNEKYAEMNGRLELIIDELVLQTDEETTMRVVYHALIETNNQAVEQVEDEAMPEEKVDNEEKIEHSDDGNGNNASEEESEVDEGSEEVHTNNEGYIETNVNTQTISVEANWKLSNNEIGKLENEKAAVNIFTAVEPGDVQVTASIGSIEKIQTIEVKDHVLRSIEIESSSLEVQESEVVELRAIGFDANGEEMEIEPTWEIISGEGTLSRVTGVENTFIRDGEGTSEILVSEDGVEATVTITVEEKGYTLTKVMIGQGRITTNPNSETFSEGQTVSVTATPAEGWEFERWSGSVSSTSATVQLTMDGDKTVEAIFKQIQQYTLTTSVTGGGSIAKSPSSDHYAKGASVTLTATPQDGFRFDHWEGDVTGSNSSVRLLMNENKTVRAVFVTVPVEREEVVEVKVEAEPPTPAPEEPQTPTPTPEEPQAPTPVPEEPQASEPSEDEPTPINTYTLHTSVQGEGAVTQPNQGSHEAGTTVEVTAKPAEGWQFKAWEGDVTGTAISLKVKMDSDKHVKAIFEPKQPMFTLETSVSGKGKIDRDNVQNQYKEGTEVKLTAKPDNGWKFSHWEGDVTGDTTEQVITMDANKKIKAIFMQVSGGAGSNSDIQIVVKPGELIEVGYVDVPEGTEMLEIKGNFGTISGAQFPDLNVKSPSNKYFGWTTDYYLEAQNITENYLYWGVEHEVYGQDSTRATYNGWAQDVEVMRFYDPKPGRWKIQANSFTGELDSTVTISSNLSWQIDYRVISTYNPH